MWSEAMFSELQECTTTEVHFISRCDSETSMSTRSMHSHALRSPVPGFSLLRPRQPMLWTVYGILGGTFDPPHVAHLAVAHAAFEQMDLDVVRLLPARSPWQKATRVVTSAKHRWAMCQLAASEAPYLIADDTEMKRQGPTYTIDTLDALSGQPVLILGSDSAVGIPTWHRADEVLERAVIAVVPRPTVSFDEVTAAIGSSYTALDMPTLDLSATAIRSHIVAGLTPEFLVPQGVLAYITANNLYLNRDA